MKILIVSSYLPFPLRSGGEIRLFNLIKHISENHEITLICEKRDHQTKEDVAEVEKICKKVITVPRKKQWSAKNILKAGFSFDPFLIVGHTSDELTLAIKDELVRENYDLIHVETFYVYQNLPKVSIPVVLVEHNVEYLVYERFAKLANPLVKPLLYIDILKLKAKEKASWERVNKLVAVSGVERKIMKRTDVAIVPNGVDVASFEFRSFQQIPDEKRILYIGDFKWLQNRDSAEFILTKIWPRISAKTNAKLWIVGRHIPDNIKQLAFGKNIILDENNKEETPQIFRKAYILLAPYRVAGGTSYKILEAMASGVGVVTSNLGIEGLEAKNGVHVLSSEKALDLSNQVLDLLKDHSLYKRLTLNARKFVENYYDWKIISKKLEEVYMSAL